MKSKWVCRRCWSENVFFDSYFTWQSEKQNWINEVNFQEGHCPECGEEDNSDTIVEIVLDDSRWNELNSYNPDDLDSLVAFLLDVDHLSDEQFLYIRNHLYMCMHMVSSLGREDYLARVRAAEVKRGLWKEEIQ